jgi:hypothetical protein
MCQSFHRHPRNAQGSCGKAHQRGREAGADVCLFIRVQLVEVSPEALMRLLIKRAMLGGFLFGH